MTSPHNNQQGTAGSEQQKEYIITEEQLSDLVMFTGQYGQFEAGMSLGKIIRSRPNTSAPAPAQGGCAGCRKEIEHLDCPTPGHCDQMKCPLCCEGSDFPTLPAEIKKYEAAAARSAREEYETGIKKFIDFAHACPLDYVTCGRIKKYMDALRSTTEQPKEARR